MASLALFKNVPCPKGLDCPYHNCLFKHPDDDENGVRLAHKPQHTPTRDNDPPGLSDDQAGPRKRQKTSSDTQLLLSSSAPAIEDLSHEKTKKNIGEGSEPTPFTPSSLRKRRADELASPSTSQVASSPHISDLKGASLKCPSPATRITQNVQQPNEQLSPAEMAPGKQRRLASSSTARARGNDEPVGRPTPKKTETLNPRAVDKAPAGHEMRHKLLVLLHSQYERLNKDLKENGGEEMKSLVLTPQQLIQQALDEEQGYTAQGPVYGNVIKNRIQALKKMPLTKYVAERTAAAKKNEKQKPSVGWHSIATNLTPAHELALVRRLVTPIDELAAHGYVPRVLDDKDIEEAKLGVEAAGGYEYCDRCSQRFQVFPGRREDGQLTTGGKCTFHWGRARAPARDPLKKDQSRSERQWACCGRSQSDREGCHTHDTHVFKASNAKRLSAVLNFAETPDNPDAPTDRAVCFDCEMGYTAYGMELIRLTATSWPRGDILLDVLVKPLGEILDLNSRFSGVFPEDISNAEMWREKTPPPPPKSNIAGSESSENVNASRNLKIVPSPQAARDLLFSLISPATPLIGHGLENDLNACRIVHPNVIDTVLLFPHERRLPFRHGLKALALKHLNMTIQVDDSGKGHDSAEDARAAGELVRFKVQREWEKMQREGWKWENSELVAPGKAKAHEPTN